MKILHINSYFASSHFYKNLYEEQVERGLDISVFVPVISGFKKKEFEYGSYTKIQHCFDTIDRLFFYRKQAKIEKAFDDNFNVKEFDLIHAHTLFTNGYLAYKLNKRFGTPYVVTVRNTDINIFLKKMPYLRKIGIEILSNAEKNIFISNSYREKLLTKYVANDKRQIFSTKSLIIPNGIDVFWLENKNEPKIYFSKKCIKILYVGEINKNKNIITTIKAIELLKKEGYQATLTVVGKKSNQSVFNKISKYNFVSYIEPKSKALLFKIYRAHDIFVMPSIHETFGLVYAEAMSQGLPVIYSRDQGFDKQFEEGIVGYSVNSFSEIEIAKKIKKIMLEYKEISERVLKLCEKFNWCKISKEYKEIYKEILKRDI